MRLVVDNSTPATDAAQRRGLLAKVHIARKSLAIVEDDYRALLTRLTGHDSARDCTDRQLGTVMDEFERMGFRATNAIARRAPAKGSVARKARAMWISLGQLGAIDDTSEAALEAFGRRQLGVDRLAWANEREGFRLIEALKAMAERHGWGQSAPAKLAKADLVRLLQDRLVGAQLARLAAAGVPGTGSIAADRAGWSTSRLRSAAIELGARIRELPKPT